MRIPFKMLIALICCGLAESYSVLNGQPVYTRQDFAEAGENFLLGSVFIERDTLRIDSLSNATFDFTRFPYQQVDTVFFRNPSHFKSSPQFGAVDLAMENSRRFTRMLRFRNDTLWEVGFLGDYLNINANVVLPFSDPTVFQVFPKKPGARYSQKIHRDIKTPYFFEEGIDSIRKLYDIRKRVKVLGAGSVKTQYGTYKGVLTKTVLREKVKGYKFSSFGWTPARRMSSFQKKTIYRWYDPDHGYPVATLVMDNNHYVKRMEYLLELPMQLSLRTRHITCHGGADGGILVQAKGGVPAYSYTWQDGTTGQFRRDLQAGSYKVTVEDNKGHTLDTTISLTEPENPFQVQIEARDEECYNDRNGRLIAHIRHGHKPYKLNWSLPRKGDTLKRVGPGTYSISVEDSEGCMAKDTAVIKGARSRLRAYLKTRDSRCKGEPQGRVETDVRGGMPPYQFHWSNGDTTRNLKQVQAGSYTLKITDSHGCVTREKALIQEPEEELLLNLQKQEVTCNGLRNGSARINVEGGKPGYAIKWFNGSTETKVENLPAGHYSVQVKDRNGCVKARYFSINEPNKLAVDFRKQQPLPHLPDGSLDACITGGTPPYEIFWNGKPGTHLRENLSAGVYRLQVVDSYNCVLKERIMLHASGTRGHSFYTMDSLMQNRQCTHCMISLYDLSGREMVRLMPYGDFMHNTYYSLPAGLYYAKIRAQGQRLIFKGKVRKGTSTAWQNLGAFQNRQAGMAR